MLSNESLDQVLERLVRIENIVKTNNPASTLRWVDVERDFSAELEKLIAKRVEEAFLNAPQRRVAGKPIARGGDVYNSATMKDNRYRRYLKAFSQDGYYKSGSQKVKPVDLALSYILMQRAWQFSQNGFTGANVPAPSDHLVQALKAMDSVTVGAGAELVNEQMASQLWDDIFLASRLAGNLMTIDMPSNPFTIPNGLGSTKWYNGTQNVATDSEVLATNASILSASELVTSQEWSYTLEEDSVVSLMPTMRMALARDGAEKVDGFALNADKTPTADNINSSGAAPLGNEYYLSRGDNGIRHQWLISNPAQNVDAGGQKLSDEHIISAFARQGKYAVDPNQNVIVTDIVTYLKGFLSLENTLTLDKFGANAVLITGQLASYRGVPIITSGSHLPVLANGRVHVNPANTFGSMSVINRLMWYIGFRRKILIEIDRDIKRRSHIMVTSLREAVTPHGNRTTNQHTSGVSNIANS